MDAQGTRAAPGEGVPTARAPGRGPARALPVAGAAGLPSIDLRGVPLHAITERQLVDHVLASLAAGRGGWVYTPNLDHLRRLVREDGYARTCSGADVRVADGMPLVWASRLQRSPLPERVAGSNVITSLSSAAADAGRSVFLLGGNDGAAEAAARVLLRASPHLRIAGTRCPPRGFEQDEGELAAMRAQLFEARPDIVFVALGSPKEERLTASLRTLLPGAWWLTVGISFSFLCGEVSRAPPWVQSAGLEWLHRLVQEPRRLGRRYLVHGVPFAVSLLTRSAARGAGRALRPGHPPG